MQRTWSFEISSEKEEILEFEIAFYDMDSGVFELEI
jgi:hypothetical protein